jgi:type IX secretion system PorP/SprF family membrane protein
MLSFGLSVGAIQYKLDESAFLNEGFDPIIAGVEQSATNLNIDFGFSYHFIDFYAHATVKNVLKNEGINNDIEITSNLRRYLVSIGNVFSGIDSEWSYEPSIMFQYKDGTQESSIDVNAKVYKTTDFGRIWGGLSYRRSFDGAEFLDGSGISTQKLQYFTPLIGVNYNNMMFAYTYSYQSNSIVFNNGGFHQLSLGFNFNCRREKYECNCPAVN